MAYTIPHGQHDISWADVLQVRGGQLNTRQSVVVPRIPFGCPADKLWRLRRDYERSELASQLGVPYDLLEAANPDGLNDLRAGKTISLGKQGRSNLQRLAAYSAVNILCAYRSCLGG